MKKRIFAVLASLFLSAQAFAATEAWTPLLTTDSFVGIRSDILLAVGSMITIILIIAGFAILIRAISR